jgi:hypothetical protein
MVLVLASSLTTMGGVPATLIRIFLYLLSFKAGSLAVCLPNTAKAGCTNPRDMKTEVWNALGEKLLTFRRIVMRSSKETA